MNTTIDYSWQLGASCAKKFNLFFPKKGRAKETQIKIICAGCPVKDKCLSHALLYEEYGYWAGTNAKDRKKMREELNINLVHINYESNKIVVEESSRHKEYVDSLPKRGPKPRKLSQEYQ